MAGAVEQSYCETGAGARTIAVSHKHRGEIKILTPDEVQRNCEAIHLTWDGESHISRAYAAALCKQLGLDAILA